MELLGLLRRLGDRLGILELASGHQKSSQPVKVRTRSVTLVELTTTIEVGDVQQLAEMPSELSVPFDEIFKTAGIQSSSTGWNIERLQQFLDSEPVRKMDRAAAQRETLEALAAEKVDPADLIRDAVSRDQALDAFQEVINRKRKPRQAALERRLAELEAQQKVLRQEIAAEEAAWRRWHDRKRQMERDMSRAIGYLIDKAVISVDEE